jgi:hypothetical protein
VTAEQRTVEVPAHTNRKTWVKDNKVRSISLPGFDPYTNMPKWAQISSDIASMIADGSLKSGDFLDPISHIAKQYEVTTATVVTALRGGDVMHEPPNGGCRGLLSKGAERFFVK